MIKALFTAASGMHAQQTNLDNTANNISNANTTAYKRTRVEFQDLIYENVRVPSPTDQGTSLPVPLQVGGGTRVVASVKNFEVGTPQETGNPLDLMIRGDGFFQVLLPDGTVGYTRDGAWKITSEGEVVNAQGLPMEPPINIPSDATSVLISPEGRVSVMTQGTVEPSEIGQIELARFVNPAGLLNDGGNVYTQSVSSGDPLTSTPGTDGTGTLEQGYLETSNVKIVNEMINLITAQRSYELNSRAVRTADDMINIATQLKR
ncbi:MAG: flagellar basal-body rod protein FlgG [Calditrichaeota bacterium]|nr:flagellar basal-body rod protein FlgG [Calditrichota bacterium]